MSQLLFFVAGWLACLTLRLAARWLHRRMVARDVRDFLDKNPPIDVGPLYQVGDLVASEERMICASIAQDFANPDSLWSTEAKDCAQQIADAIRAREDTVGGDGSGKGRRS